MSGPRRHPGESRNGRASDGTVYVTGDVVAALGAGPFTIVSAGSADLQGIGPTALCRVEP